MADLPPLDAPAAGAPPDPRDPPLGPMVLRVALAMLALVVLQTVLTLPGARDPETWLGLGRADRPEVQAVREAWHSLPLLVAGPLHATLADAARLYWVLDTALFMPMYGWLLLELARRMAAGASRASTQRLAAWLPWFVLALLAVDLVENSGGLARLALQGGAGEGGATVAGAAVAALLAALSAGAGAWLWQRRLDGRALLAAMVSTRHRAERPGAATAAGPVTGAGSPATVPRAPAGWSHLPRRAAVVMLAAAAAALALVAAHAFAAGFALEAGAWVHRAKLALVAVPAVALLFFAARWLWREGVQDEHERAQLRRGLGDILFWRTRYVLLALAMLVALTLALDQCRDVAIGVADGLFSWPQALWAWPTMMLSVLAVWAMSFSCWLWTRLACRMPSPGVATEHAPKVEQRLGLAARGAARVLGIVPTFVVAMMSALAARDALWAGARDEGGWLVAPVVLLAMGLACVLGGRQFLWGREQAGAAPAPRQAHAAPVKDYYNDRAFGPPNDWMECVRHERYRFVLGRGPGPAKLPVIALALAVLLRCVAVLAEPGVPLAFVVIVLSLVGWLGFFGWLSMKEEREARPWLLVLLLVAGALGLSGLTDNHVVRVAQGADAAALPALGWQVASLVALAGLLLGAAWVLAHRARWLRGWKVRAGIGVAAVALLAAVDRAGAPAAPATAGTGSAAAAQALAPPTLEQRFERWAAAAWRDGEGEPPARVLLVASEGGGVRAAYWTARVLAELRRTLPQFERQLLVLSGVSGGAVGEAVFAACPRDGLDACVQGFGQADLLTPLVGAWMFEDVLARVLPTSLPHNRWFNRYCLQPGCGFLSRGLWFEQAMERSVPGLKRGITAAGAEGPWLLLNATWVETGDRAIASGVEVEWQGDRFANARDQLAFVSREGRAGVDMPLSAAAHNAARFPFVNAIGRLRDGRGTQAHLADGGYFDNAGAHGAIDVLARLRRWVAEQPACAEGDARCQRQQAWLRRLKPLVIVVQNGVPDTCSTGTPGEQLDCLQRIWQRRAQTAPDAYEPAAPAQAGRWTLFVDALGPLVTLANVAGTGSNGRRAEALLKRECQRFGAGNDGCVLRIAQRSDGGVLYPLGWYLSPTARRALDRQAQERVAQAVQALQR